MVTGGDMQITIELSDIKMAIKDYVEGNLIQSGCKITGFSGLPVEIDVFIETEAEAETQNE